MSPSGSVVASSTWALSSIPTAAAPLVQPANGSELGSGAAVCAEATKVEVEDTTRMNLMQPAPSLPSSSQVQPSQRIDNGEGVEPFPTSPPAASSFPPTDCAISAGASFTHADAPGPAVPGPPAPATSSMKVPGGSRGEEVAARPKGGESDGRAWAARGGARAGSSSICLPPKSSMSPRNLNAPGPPTSRRSPSPRGPHGRYGRYNEDVSYRRDAANSQPGATLATSPIPPDDYISETSPLPSPGAEYRDEDGKWHSVVFPSRTPSSRRDAILLDQWITRALADKLGGLGAQGDLTAAVDELVPLLSIGLNEAVRQVSHHCAERGLVIEKIWSTYVELFDRVLSEMRRTHERHKIKAKSAQSELDKYQAELAKMKEDQPKQLQKLVNAIEQKVTRREEEMDRRMKTRDTESSVLYKKLQQMHEDLEICHDTVCCNGLGSTKIRGSTTRRRNGRLRRTTKQDLKCQKKKTS
eukprot:GHVT01068493.1.p1 GENE.GHVT01068493.1~~GHVT01068493.1.p1  ORF type:complete len:470 (-),score=77.77 GHVT01068493.1:1859-3268(-)